VREEVILGNEEEVLPESGEGVLLENDGGLLPGSGEGVILENVEALRGS